MTSAGLKSKIYAGLSKHDSRVKAATADIRSHYTVDENPGQGQRGLYYLFQTFAKAMAMLGEAPFLDADGKGHDWRADLVGAPARRQAENDHWVNRSDVFTEWDANIVTSHGLLALAAAAKA